MAMTSVDLPPELVAAAKAATGESTARGAITAALRQTVARAAQRDALEALAGMDFLGGLADPELVREATR